MGGPRLTAGAPGNVSALDLPPDHRDLRSLCPVPSGWVQSGEAQGQGRCSGLLSSIMWPCCTSMAFPGEGCPLSPQLAQVKENPRVQLAWGTPPAPPFRPGIRQPQLR